MKKRIIQKVETKDRLFCEPFFLCDIKSLWLDNANQLCVVGFIY